MKTPQVILLVAAVVGLCFGVTYISVYTPSKDGNQAPVGASIPDPPLRFPYMTAGPDSNTERFKYWRSEYEAGEHGHFDYWFTNTHPQEVSLHIAKTNCQCAGGELGTISADGWEQFLRDSATQGFPGFEGAALLGVANLLAFQKQITWEKLIDGTAKPERHVRPASPERGPTVGIVRLSWVPPAGGQDRTLDATLSAQLPNTTAMITPLLAHYKVVEGVRLFAPLTMTPDVRLGYLQPFSTPTSEFICWSTTRPELDLSVALDNPAIPQPCLEWSQPVILTPQELTELNQKISSQGMPVTVRVAYRVKLKAYERRTLMQDGKPVLHQLDIGPAEFKLAVYNRGDANPFKVFISGIVRGDVRLGGNAVENSRVNMGDAFSAQSDHTVSVSVFSDKPGLDVELVEKETTPSYLQARLVPIDEIDGRKEWRLSVTVPAGSVVGPMPYDCFIVLKTKDASQRRIRIPIRGTAVSNGLSGI